MNKIMIVGDYTLNIVYEETSRHDITYRIAMLPGVEDVAFLYDNNNASGKWHLLRLGNPAELIDKAKRICAR